MLDNILVMNICERHKRPISFKQFFKLGFITTVYQLTLVTLIFILIFELILDIILITTIFLSISAIYLLHKNSRKIGLKIDKLFNKIRIIIR
jgi:hypothetical protein